MPQFQSLATSEPAGRHPSLSNLPSGSLNSRQQQQQQQQHSSGIMGFFMSLLAALMNMLRRLRPEPIIKLNHRRFTVQQQLGEGGFSFVYLVRELGGASAAGNSHGQYALKSIRIQLPEQEDRLLHEIAAHKAVDSPHVLKLLDSQLVKGHGGNIVEGRLLLPFFEHGTVQDLIDRSAPGSHLPLHRILQISIDVCKGLLAFHTREPPLAFRDLKPANILLDGGGRAVLMDLGSVTHARVRITSRREAVALQELCAETVTAPYRAPELFDPSSDTTITEASDVWYVYPLFKVAVLLDPIDGSMTAAISGRISYPPDDPYGLQFHTILEGILKTQPSARPSVAQLEQMLTRFLGTVSVSV
eukprot:jgi/Hompol1/3705/HPOL_000840-RA